MSIIISAHTTHPIYEYSQQDLAKYLGSIFPDKSEVVERIFKNALVGKRRLSLPIETYQELKGLEFRNNQWHETALDLQTKNLEYLFHQLKFPIEDISMIISTTITGLAIPSLETKFMNRFAFSKKTKRIPLFGLGCLAGVASVARAHDYLKSYPTEAVLIMATELCSLTFQMQDFTMSNIVGTSLFADGAGVILMVGNKHPWKDRGAYEVCSTESIFFPDTERIMGWDIVDQGFKLVLSGDVPKIVNERFVPAINDFLKNQQISTEQIKFYISHPGGPKVLNAMEESLGLGQKDLALSYESLREHGNMSSVSVINVLNRTIAAKREKPGTMGLMLAMGPAFCGEVVTLRAK